MDCPICIELMVSPLTLACGHSGCKLCLVKWVQTKPECPICRTKATPNFVGRLSVSISLQDMIAAPLEERRRAMALEEQEERKKLAAKKKRKARQQNVQKQPEKNTTESRRRETRAQKGKAVVAARVTARVTVRETAKVAAAAVAVALVIITAGFYVWAKLVEVEVDEPIETLVEVVACFARDGRGPAARGIGREPKYDHNECGEGYSLCESGTGYTVSGPIVTGSTDTILNGDYLPTDRECNGKPVFAHSANQNDFLWYGRILIEGHWNEIPCANKLVWLIAHEQDFSADCNIQHLTDTVAISRLDTSLVTRNPRPDHPTCSGQWLVVQAKSQSYWLAPKFQVQPLACRDGSAKHATLDRCTTDRKTLEAV